MKMRIIINTLKLGDDMEVEEHRAEVWRGDMEIMPEGEYLAKVSIIADGINEPICDIPFSVMVGHYQWIPPLTDNDKLEDVEQKIIENTESKNDRLSSGK